MIAPQVDPLSTGPIPLGLISAVSRVQPLILSFSQTVAGTQAYHTIRKRFSHIVIIS